jgi:hypothetical protein
MSRYNNYDTMIHALFNLFYEGIQVLFLLRSAKYMQTDNNIAQQHATLFKLLIKNTLTYKIITLISFIILYNSLSTSNSFMSYKFACSGFYCYRLGLDYPVLDELQ